jgi:hypothetical protein
VRRGMGVALWYIVRANFAQVNVSFTNKSYNNIICQEEKQTSMSLPIPESVQFLSVQRASQWRIPRRHDSLRASSSAANASNQTTSNWYEKMTEY